MTIEEEIARTLAEYLVTDFEHGPFSDTSFARAEVEPDGMVSLFASDSESAWPVASFDAPQLAEWIARSPLLNRVRAEAQAKAIQAHRDLHPTYGSTAACGGGIGGMTLTEHCAVVCQNPKHDAAKSAWHEVERDYFESRRIEQNSEGNET